MVEAGVKSVHLGESTTVNQVHAIKVEIPKIEKFAYASNFKEMIFAPEKPCDRCSKNSHLKFFPFKHTECNFCHKFGYAAKVNFFFKSKNEEHKKSWIKTVQEEFCLMFMKETLKMYFRKKIRNFYDGRMLFSTVISIFLASFG